MIQQKSTKRGRAGRLWLAALALFTSLVCAQPALARSTEGDVDLGNGLKFHVKLIDRTDTDAHVEIYRDGALLQRIGALGDIFEPFQADGKPVFFHALALRAGENKDLVVRTMMMPTGVMRVLRWDAANQKFQKVKFGKKKEDGVLVSLRLPVTLRDNGDVEYDGVNKRAHLAKRFILHWTGTDYQPVKQTAQVKIN